MTVKVVVHREQLDAFFKFLKGSVNPISNKIAGVVQDSAKRNVRPRSWKFSLEQGIHEIPACQGRAQVVSSAPHSAKFENSFIGFEKPGAMLTEWAKTMVTRGTMSQRKLQAIKRKGTKVNYGNTGVFPKGTAAGFMTKASNRITQPLAENIVRKQLSKFVEVK